MERIATATKAVDLYGAGKHGFKDGNLGLGISPTDLEAAWFNGTQEELLALIEGAGIAPGVALTQVRQAIKRLFAGNLGTITAAGPTALTADNAGLVLVDATANNVAITLPAANAVAGVPLQFQFVRVDATANTVTISRAGADTFIGGGTSFTMPGQGAFRTVKGDAVSKWCITSSDANTGAVRPGTVIEWTGTSAPSGYLLCPTAQTNISRTTYAAVFAEIGTTWGVGDGATTFGMPWYPVDYASVQANGNVGTQTVGANITHTHAMNADGRDVAKRFGSDTSIDGSSSTSSVDDANYSGSQNTGTSGGSANLAAGVRILKCMKY